MYYVAMIVFAAVFVGLLWGHLSTGRRRYGPSRPWWEVNDY